MFLVPAVLVGVVVGLLMGGRLERLGDLTLRLWWLFFAAIGLQLVAYPSALMPYQAPEDVAVVLQVASYAGLVAVTVANLRVPGMAVAGLGMVANLAAILANGGHMPALRSALEGAGRVYDGTHNNSVATDSPALPWLVDRWAAPGWVPWGNVFSVGDVLIAAGVVVLVASAMGVRSGRWHHGRRGVEPVVQLGHEVPRGDHAHLEDAVGRAIDDQPVPGGGAVPVAQRDVLPRA